MGKTVGKLILLAMLFGLLWGCSTSGSKRPVSGNKTPAAKPLETLADIPDAIPRETPPSPRGNPKSYVVFGKRYYIRDTSRNFQQRGIASWYGPKFHGRPTSSGTPFDMYAMTAAHKTLPIPTYVKVTHLETGRSVVVEVNDRGPFIDGRVIDLSYAAAQKLGMAEAGTAEVKVTALPPYQYLAKSTSATPTLAGPVTTAYQPTRSVASSSGSFSSRPQAAGAGEKLNPTTAVYLQVGAFSERRNAEQLQNRLANILRRVIRIDSSTGAMHKVRVGPFSDTTEAALVTTELASLGISRPHLVFE